MHPVAKTWHLLPHDPSAIDQVSRALRLSPLVVQLLFNRGMREPESMKRFLDIPFNGLHEPSRLPGVAEAVDRLDAAIRAGKRICVYGDYDVDGLTGTALLWQALRLLGAPADFYVPHRLEEGYGLNAEALAQIARSGAAVVVTVDCGITSIAEAEEAKRLGLELIITDHHEFTDRLPDAAAVVHPRLPGGNYPFGDLSGSGVAFKLTWALCQRASGAPRVTPQWREFLLDSVSLAALGMVADCVPLLDENRIVVRHGLARLRKTGSVGLKALLAAAGLADKAEVCAGDIGFLVAPRINAAGRLGCARLVVELLTTTARERAVELTRFLDGQNSQRQQIERRILHQARELLAGYDLEQTPALVLASADWHPGVIGIVAGRLTELYGRPTLLIALRDGEAPGHGSGRSVPGFPLHEALRACRESLVNHGGHAAAAGFKILPPHIDDFRARFCRYAAQSFPDGPPAPRLTIDAEVTLGMLTPGVVAALGRLEPYGAGNPRPRFLAGPLQVVGEPRRVGKGERHLQFRVRQQGTVFPTIAFNLADRVEELMSAGGQCCLVFTPAFNVWQGRRSIQLEVADFQPGPQTRLG